MSGGSRWAQKRPRTVKLGVRARPHSRAKPHRYWPGAGTPSAPFSTCAAGYRYSLRAFLHLLAPVSCLSRGRLPIRHGSSRYLHTKFTRKHRKFKQKGGSITEHTRTNARGEPLGNESTEDTLRGVVGSCGEPNCQQARESFFCSARRGFHSMLPFPFVSP